MTGLPLSLNVERALVESLAWLTKLLDEAPDDEADPDAVCRWMESTSDPLWRLSTSDRQALAAFCRTFADERPDDPGLRDALTLFIRSVDLDHDYGT